MDILGPLFQLLFRALFVVFPLAIGWLSFRRLMRSRSANAWIYAITCLFTSVIAAGLLPWTLGLGSANWLFFMFSAISPVIWMGVVMICDPADQSSHYDTDEVDDVVDGPIHATHSERVARSRPLILEEPAWPDTPTLMFRHSRMTDVSDAVPEEPSPVKSMLSVAKGMRGNETSERRRPRLLPAPDRYGVDLPFLHRS